MCDDFTEGLLDAAEALWRENPPPKEIAERNGWGWHFGRTGFEWCGHTVACVLRQAGVDPQLCAKTFPSTARLANRGPEGSRWTDHGYERPAVSTSDLRPGDVVCVVTRPGRSYGDHIVLCTEVHPNGTFSTIEGNATGLTATGTVAKGVVKRTRELDDVRQVLRITKEHKWASN